MELAWLVAAALARCGHCGRGRRRGAGDVLPLPLGDSLPRGTNRSAVRGQAGVVGYNQGYADELLKLARNDGWDHLRLVKLGCGGRDHRDDDRRQPVPVRRRVAKLDEAARFPRPRTTARWRSSRSTSAPTTPPTATATRRASCPRSPPTCRYRRHAPPTRRSRGSDRRNELLRHRQRGVVHRPGAGPGGRRPHRRVQRPPGITIRRRRSNGGGRRVGLRRPPTSHRSSS